MKTIIKILLVMLLIIQSASAINSTVYNIDKVPTILTKTFQNNIHTEINVVDDADRITSLSLTLLNNSADTAYIVRFPNNISYYVKYTRYYEYSFFGYGGIPYRNERVFLTVSNSSNSSQTFLIYGSNLNWSYVVNQHPKTEIKYDVTSSTTFYKTYPNVFLYNVSFYQTTVFWGMPASNIVIDSTSPFDLEITVEDISSLMAIEKQKKSLSTISGYIYSAYINSIGLVFGDSKIILDILSILDILFFVISGIFILLFVYPYLLSLYIIIIINLKTAYESINLRSFIFNYGNNIKSMSIIIYNIAIELWDLLLKIIQTIITIGSFLRQLLQI